MVQEKDAAKKRVEARRAFAEARRADLERRTIKFRWAVNEHTPGYNTGGYYDTDVKAVDRIVSPYFDTEAEAEEWMGRHEPDKGNTLSVVRQRLLKREWTEWVSY